MDLSKAVAGTALILIIVLAVGHASAQTKSHQAANPPEKSADPSAGQKQPVESPGTRARSVA